MRRSLSLVLLACGMFVAALVGLQVVLGVQPDITQPANTEPGTLPTGQMTACNAPLVQASRLLGLEVRNDSQQKLGTIEDLAINPNTGKIRYAVLSVGGAIDLGGKLLPVPWTILKTIAKPATTEGVAPQTYCVLNVGNDVLQHAPTFVKGQWMNFNNHNWLVAIDTFYQPYIARQHAGATTR